MKQGFEQVFGEGVMKYRWVAIALCFALALGAGSGMRFLGMSTDYRVFFSPENPQLIAFDTLEKRFAKNDNVLIAVAPKDGNVFTRETLGAIQELTNAGWKLPYSSRVDSVTNFQYSQAMGDELVVGDLVKHPVSLGASALKVVRDRALNEPLIKDRLVSSTGHVAAVNITFLQPGTSNTEVPGIIAASRSLVAEFEKEYPQIDFHMTGMLPMDNAFSEAAQNDMATLVPLMFLIMIGAIWIAVRSVSGVVSTVVVIFMSIATGMGLAGWSGILITGPSASAPTMIMTLAIADCIHILVTMLHEMRKGREKREAIVESVRVNLQPIFLTSITTAIGFLSMNFSDAPPFHDLGNIVAMGVTAAFFFSIFFFPAFLSLLPLKISVRKEGEKELFDRFGDFVVNYRRSLFWGMSLFIVVLLSGIPRIEFYDIFTEYFDKRYTFRTDSDFVRGNLTGLDIVEYSLGSGEESGVSDPDYLKTVEAFSQWFRAQPEVVHVNSFTDIMKRLNKNMHGDDPAYYVVPDNRELAAQYLLLYEMSLPFGMDINNQVDVAKSTTRFSVTLKEVTTQQLRDVAQRGEQWLEENAPASMRSVGIGPSVMFSYISERNINSMLGGTTLALALISLILVVALRSFKVGLISLIPNLVPAAMAFGLWGLLVGEVGLALSVVSAMSLGIVVDDTVHFLSKYLRARREHGMTAPEAVRYSFHNVGRALWITSATLVIGFGLLATSGFRINSDMGLLTAIAIAFALVADFLFLPPLLMLLDRDKGVAKEESEALVPGYAELEPAFVPVKEENEQDKNGIL